MSQSKSPRCKKCWSSIEHTVELVGGICYECFNKQEVPQLHVIEYSAYAQLMEAAEEMAKALNYYTCKQIFHPNVFRTDGLEHWDTAKIALEKFEAFKKAGGK